MKKTVLGRIRLHSRSHKMSSTGLFLLVFSALVAFAGGVAVMSIDLGAEFMKIAIVKPGVPMEIATNKDSSRKTRTLVAFRDGERQFANMGYTTAVRFPKKAFWYLTHLIGRNFDDPLVSLYKKRFPYYDLIKDEERGTVVFQLEDGTTYSVEELLAMILDSAREYAENFADHPIKDAVITVPAYFNQAERRAVASAANMTGINILQLMSDNAAVALNYGVFRRKNFNSTMQYYIFYDMGASSTVASVVGYQVVKMKDGTRVETNPQVVIKGVGFDRTLGGLDFTLRLRDYLATTFNEQKKTKTDVYTNDRSMAKLLKEADRVKTVLSANSDHYAQIEGLLEENDFRAKVSREKFEELCDDLYSRVVKPLEEALKVSEITLGEIDDVILMGGGTRSPRVQEELLKFLGRNELGKSINTDESAAMGAVYQAAYLGKGFKVKTFGVKEGNIYPIVVEFEKHKNVEAEEEPVKVVKRTLFGRMNPFPQKKVMTFNKHFTDFTFNVGYGDLSYLSDTEKESFSQLLLKNVSLTGVEEAYNKYKDTESKGIKAHFRMDESGILNLDKVEAVFEKTGDAAAEDESAWSKIGSAIGGLFGGSEEKDGVTTESKEVPKSEDAKNETKEEKTNKTEKTEEGKEKTAEKETKEKSDSKDEKTEKSSSDKEEKKEKTKEKSSDKEEKSDKEDAKDKKEEKDGKKEGKKDEKDEEPKKPKIVTVKEEIATSVSVLDVADHSDKQMKASKKKLKALKAKDREKADLERAKNELESYIFDSQDKLSQDNYVKCSTEKEREDLNKRMSEASDWLYEQPDDAKKDVYEDELKSLKKSMSEVLKRVYEMEERPKAMDALKSMLNHSDYFLKSVKNLTTMEDPMFTEVEVTSLEKLINETYDWRKTNLADQKKWKSYETPKILVEDIAVKIQALDREVKYLLNKAKYWKPKAKPKKENETSTDGEKKANTTEKNENTTKIETEDADSTTDTPETQEETPPESTESKTEESKTEDKAEEETLQLDSSDSEKDEHTEL